MYITAVESTMLATVAYDEAREVLRLGLRPPEKVCYIPARDGGSSVRV